MKIGNFDTRQKVFIIAEIGNNHEGDFSLAERMVKEAAQSGADAVKFQTIVPELLVASTDQARLTQLRKFQLSRSQFEKLKSLADNEKVLFLSTPFDIESANWLNSLVPAFKIASSDNTFWPLLDQLSQTGKPLILSTGLMSEAAVHQTVEFLQTSWKRHGVAAADLALLRCVVSYPTADADANLKSILALAIEGVTPGYSDHTIGVDAAILSVALGARIIEKHFTFDKTRSTFRDHQLSADPADFRRMVEGIRRAEVLLGDGKIAPTAAEGEITPLVRRSIAAKHQLPAGHLVTIEDLIWVRPGKGFAPGSEGAVLGKRLASPIEQGEIFSSVHLKD